MIYTKKIVIILIFQVIILCSIVSFVLAQDVSLITAQPFTTERRLDLNTADEYDFMDIVEIDMLKAYDIINLRRSNGPFLKEEDILNILSYDSFIDIFETIEIGNTKTLKLNSFNGNGYSDWFYDVNNKNSLSSYTRYNLNFDNTIDIRVAFGQVTSESYLKLNEKFLNYYFYTDSYLKKGYIIESSPPKKIIPQKIKTLEEIKEERIKELDEYFSEKTLLGRKKRKKINGLFETDLDSYKKYMLVRRDSKKQNFKKTNEDYELQNTDSEENKVKAIKLELPEYENKNSNTITTNLTSENELNKENNEKLLSMVLSVGDVMLPQGKAPLINLHRRNNSGVKITKYFQNLDLSLIGTKIRDKNEHRIGSALNAKLNSYSLAGGRVEKIWDNDFNHSIDMIHLYGMGRMDKVSIYGEIQNVFNGAESIFTEVTSSFRDVNITTRILSVKENFKDPKATAPYSFDGQFSTFLRFSYNFSDKATFATSYQISDLKQGNPDYDLGTNKIFKNRILLYPNLKSKIMFTYMDEYTPIGTINSTFSTSVRYLYKPKINLIGKFVIKDEDTDNYGDRKSETSLEWQRHVTNNLKVAIKYINIWDEKKLNTPDEFENILKLAYFRSF